MELSLKKIFNIFFLILCFFKLSLSSLPFKKKNLLKCFCWNFSSFRKLDAYLCPEEGNVSVLRVHLLLILQSLPRCYVLALAIIISLSVNLDYKFHKPRVASLIQVYSIWSCSSFTNYSMPAEKKKPHC